MTNRWMTLLSKLPGSAEEKQAWWDGEHMDAVVEAAKLDGLPVASTIVRYYRRYLQTDRRFKHADQHEALNRLADRLDQLADTQEVLRASDYERARALAARLRARARK